MRNWLRNTKLYIRGALAGPASVGAVTRRSRAVILVLTTWIIVILTLIATSLVFEVQISSKLTMLQREQFQAYFLAKSAIGLGITHLQNDLLMDFSENPNQRADAFSDVWAQPDRREKDVEVPIDDRDERRTFQLEILDEESKIPINFANAKVLKAMLEFYGFEEPDSDEVAAAIVDYRDQDDLAAGVTGEKENEYYSAAMGQRITPDMTVDQLQYRSANELMVSTEQLLEVYGLAQFPEIYYGYDPYAKSEKAIEARADAAEGRKVRERSRRKRGNEVLPLKDVVTVSHPTGRVNMNTASFETLAILLHAGTNFASIDTAKTTAKSIVEYRGGPGTRKKADADEAFKSLQDLAQVPGVDVNVINQLGSLGIQPVFSSDTFRVIGIGRTPKAVRTLQAIVERKMESYNPDDARLASNKGTGSSRNRTRTRRKTGGNSDETDTNIRLPAIRVLQWIE